MKTIYTLIFGFFISISANYAQTISTTPSPGCHEGKCVNIISQAVSGQEATRDGNDSLLQIYNQSMCGLNYTSASTMVTTRYTPAPGVGLPASLPISLPPCVGGPNGQNILQAYLWWIVSYDANSSTTPTLVITNPDAQTDSFQAVLAGTSGPKCWGEIGTRLFRADVTSNISSSGNYVVDIIGNTVWEIDGVTLLIIYRDPFATYQGNLIIHDGIITGIGNPTAQTINNFNACANSSFGNGFTITSDNQDNLFTPNHDVTINSQTATYPNLFWNFDTASATVVASQTTSDFGITPGQGDCYSWAVMGLYFQTTTCVICTPPTALSLSFQHQDANCGQNNGSATVNVTGGSPPYTYQWSTTPPQTTATASNLGSGTYYVTVTDSSGCFTAMDSVVIDDPGDMVLSTTSTDVLCFGLSTGSATVSIDSGGTSPFSYSWNTTPVQTTSAASNLSAGNYVVVVTDDNNCTATAVVQINEPDEITVSFDNFSHTSCGNNNGSISPTYSGGVGNYSYSWNTVPVQTTASVINLSAGSYTVTVTDSNNCSVSASFTINPSAAPSVLTSSSPPDICVGQSATLTASGASTYEWSPAASLSSSTGNSVTANPVVTTIYQVIGTDQAGCTDTATVTLTVNPLPLVSSPPSPQICAGGTVTITMSGADYYRWSPQTGLSNANGPDSTSVDATLNVTTVYTVTGYTLEGCSATATVTVTVNPAPIPVITPGGPTTFCEGGSVILTASGGSNFLWSDNSTGASITVTAAGTYTVTITENNCSASTSETVTVNPLPVAAITPGSPVLICSNNPALLTATGGPGYTYQWYMNNSILTGETNQTLSVSDTGFYSVVITDANNCSASSAPVQVMEGLGPEVTIVGPPQVGCLQNTIYIGYGPQSATLTAVSSTAVSYLWSTGETTQAISVTASGTYSVTAYDAFGCPSEQSPESQITITIVDIRCGHGMKKVLFCHVPEGNPGNPQTICIAPSAVNSHLALHQYDCIGPCSLYYQRLSETEIVDVVSIYPNPSNSTFIISATMHQGETMYLNVYDMTGRKVLSQNIVAEKTEIGAALSEGVYHVEIVSGATSAIYKIVKL